ncbi:MAG: hypothetical protein M1352_00460 [Patescibacteria group bacterium]|nr:hypothetical protein [Patescibacteria group bacterium]
MPKLVFYPSGHIDPAADPDEQKRQIEFFGPEAGEFAAVDEEKEVLETQEE